MMTSFHQSHKPRRIKTTTAAKPPRPPATSPPVLKCPRCDSVNTKFCYYNNYSLSQPRHYCKNCRRYWTRGGALRNVPIGGSTRNKNKPPCSTLHVISPPPPPHGVMTSLSSSHDLIDGFHLLNPPSTTSFSNYMFPLNPNYNLAPLNQDLHHTLITSMFLQDSLPVNDKPVLFQNFDLVPPSTTTADWVYDSSAIGGGGATSGRNENNGDSEGNVGIWYHNGNNTLP
ncbi:hypothetical protein AALP_AA7G256900 [Arabis alpina]|uniref:Dof zinc finger protein n=1 Tax=Arabis alpina TaxID=50452 RepID=A0A087GKK4_ARAAL|nr:hypothetical protein AALP_AA7G256900 [Arabis alpina]